MVLPRQVETVSYYTYMRLLFTPNLVGTKAKDNLVDKANKSIIVNYYNLNSTSKVFNAHTLKHS